MATVTVIKVQVIFIPQEKSPHHALSFEEIRVSSEFKANTFISSQESLELFLFHIHSLAFTVVNFDTSFKHL